MFVWDKEYFLENCMHVPCLNTSRSKTYEKICFILKMPNRGAAAVLLIQVHHIIKKYL